LRGLWFIKLERDSLRLLIFIDISFANNRDLSSQIRYILVLADINGTTNILYWSSIKYKRVTQSVLASELYTIVYRFNIGASIKATVKKILEIDLLLVLCTDSRSLYDYLIKLGTIIEKRLMIDMICL
jgi:hypothetical protein